VGDSVSETNNPSKGGCYETCKEKNIDQKNCYTEKTGRKEKEVAYICLPTKKYRGSKHHFYGCK
jgi:hypothetical protein